MVVKQCAQVIDFNGRVNNHKDTDVRAAVPFNCSERWMRLYRDMIAKSIGVIDNDGGSD